MKRSSPLFRSLLKKVALPFIGLKQKLSSFLHPTFTVAPLPANASLGSYAVQHPRANTKWVLAETSDNDDKNKNVVMVEVEVFPDATVADLSNHPHEPFMNYTIEGDDPNLRITHYPSNRLH